MVLFPLRMGRTILHEGRIYDEGADNMPKDATGNFARPNTQFDSRISEHDCEPGRYVLLAAFGCPWAHRAIIARELKGLTSAVDLVSTEGWWPITCSVPAVCTKGWRLDTRLPTQLTRACSTQVQELAQKPPFYVHHLYIQTDPKATGRVTVPVLWDQKLARIVNNESADILRILNADLGALAQPGAPDLYPEALRAEIERLNPIVYSFNNGVYRAGFGSPEAAGKAVETVFEVLGMLDETLAGRRFLAGDVLTETDVRAYTTLIRFDVAYYPAFRCDHRMVQSYPHLSRYLEELWQMPAFRKTSQLHMYTVFYFCITRWHGRIASNLLRLCSTLLWIGCGAANPGSWWWCRCLGSVLCFPFEMAQRVVPSM